MGQGERREGLRGPLVGCRDTQRSRTKTEQPLKELGRVRSTQLRCQYRSEVFTQARWTIKVILRRNACATAHFKELCRRLSAPSIMLSTLSDLLHNYYILYYLYNSNNNIIHVEL